MIIVPLLCLTHHNVCAKVVKASTGHSIELELVRRNNWQSEGSEVQYMSNAAKYNCIKNYVTHVDGDQLSRVISD